MPDTVETPEEKEVRNIVDEAKEQLRQLDEALYANGPMPAPVPPGGGHFMGPGVNQRIVDEQARDHARKAIVQEALDRSAIAIQGAPIATQTKAFKILDAFVYPDTAPPPDRKDKKDIEEAQRSAMNKLGRTERSDSKKEQIGIDEAQRSALHQMGYSDMDIRHEREKDLSQSQDYTMRKLGDEKEKTADKEQVRPKESSMAEAFTQSLRYHHVYGEMERVPVKEDVKEVFSMADHYTSSLGYNRLSDSHNPPSPTIENRTDKIDVDRD